MTLETQWMTMTVMLSSGLMLGVILDTYRVLKHRFRIKGWVVSLVDFVYWFVSAVLVFSMLMWSNWGELRFYIFIAICAGFFFYYRWWSSSTMRFLHVLIHFIEQILYGIVKIIYRCIWLPLVYLTVLLKKIMNVLLRIVWKIVRILLLPIQRLTHPIWQWMQPSIYKGKKKWKIFQTWWQKIRKKGE